MKKNVSKKKNYTEKEKENHPTTCMFLEGGVLYGFTGIRSIDSYIGIPEYHEKQPGILVISGIYLFTGNLDFIPVKRYNTIGRPNLG